MADELYDAAMAVKALMDDISIVKKTHLGHPDSTVTSLEVAVIVDRLRHGQAGTSAHGQTHYMLLRCYAPVSGHGEGAEEKLYKLWNLMIDTLNANISLGGTVSRSNLERGRMGFKTVAGVKCRTLDARLEAYLIQPEAYHA